MLSRLLIGGIIGLFLVLVPLSGHAASLARYDTEQSAQAHCPADVVVWLNNPSMIYHFKGQRWYGNTKDGAFVCKTEAELAGARPSKRG